MDENVTDLKESINELKEEFRSKCKIAESGAIDLMRS